MIGCRKAEDNLLFQIIADGAGDVFFNELAVIPITYRNLVGGGCSLRFQMCALVKGMSAGIIFMLLTSAVDMLIWSSLGASLGWSPLTNMVYVSAIYQIWFLSGAVGGMGARIMEVRGYSDPGDRIVISGYDN